MTITTEQNISDFKFWSGAVNNANRLTIDELDTLEDVLTDIYPDGINETQLNDIMWFEFSWVCEALGYKYDEENDEIIREPSEE